MAKNNVAVKKKHPNKSKFKSGMKRKIPQKNEATAQKKSKSVDYSTMSVDDFINKEIERPSDEEDQEIDFDSGDETEIIPKEIISQVNNDDEGSENEDSNEFESHKDSLAKLKETDPSFYKFLQDNDKKLLQFNDSDSEDDDEKNEKLHKPSEEELEGASDESDFEGEDETAATSDKVITLKLLKQWQKEITADKSAKTINCLIKAFQAALIRVSNDESVSAVYKIDGSAVFNGVVQLCVLELGPALKRYLKLSEGSKQPANKSKHFVKIKGSLRGYFQDLLKLLGGVTSTNIRNVLLKHLHYMTPFLVCFSNVTRKMLKKLIYLWGTAEESVRVIAFMVILRITNNHQPEYLDLVLKSMYMTYVKNCKFMSTNTMPEINFMRRSLTEMFTLDVNVSYQHVFLYIRQLAIHLRSAVTLHKKENLAAVLNWQFVNSIHLWANLLTVTCNKPQLQPLIYPLVQVTLGIIKLIPTAQYFPLRFNCLQILTELSRDTNIFIPILPFLLEALTGFDFNKKHKKVSMKPLSFTCIIRVPKSQMIENGFKDAVIDSLYGLLLEYLASQSHSISFPDLILFCTLQIKQFLKKCSVANYSKKIKQLLDKIEQNSKFIENERKKVKFNIHEFKKIEAWEAQIKIKGTPLNIFFESWKKVHSVKKRKEATMNDELADYALPVLKKKITKEKKKQEGPVELFPSDSEDDENEDYFNKKAMSDEELGEELDEDLDEELDEDLDEKIKDESEDSDKSEDSDESEDEEQEKLEKIKPKKTKKQKKNKQKVETNDESDDDIQTKDEVKDFNMADW